MLWRGGGGKRGLGRKRQAEIRGGGRKGRLERGRGEGRASGRPRERGSGRGRGGKLRGDNGKESRRPREITF